MKTAQILAILLPACVLSHNTSLWGQEPQAASKEPQRSPVVAFVNVNVVPMDRERILPGQTVIVRAHRISEIGPADTTDIPEGALRIDGRDKYLMPGLVDMHVHQPHDHDYQLTFFITNGVTAIRNMWGSEYSLTLREQVETGKVIGPTIYTTGPMIDGVSYTSPSGLLNTLVETREQTAQVVAEHKKAGYDFIKVYEHLSVECYDAIIEAAAKHGMLVVGHVPQAVDLEHVLAAGQHSVEHLYGYNRFLKVEDISIWEQLDEAKIPHIVQATRKAGSWNCPTLVAMDPWGMSSEKAEPGFKLANRRYLPPRIKHGWLRVKRLDDPNGLEDPNNSRHKMSTVKKMSNRKQVAKALHDAGARILLGSDCPNLYVVAGFSIHQELRHVVDAGLTPYEAIKAGTRDAADCLGELDEFGTISAGLRADLILVEGNPLEDVGHVGSINGVMARGRWFPQSELQAMLDALAVKHATEENPNGAMLGGRWYWRAELEAMVDWCKETVNLQNESQREELVETVLSSDRLLVDSSRCSRRSRPVAPFIARQLAQLGLQAYVAGGATTPAARKGDLLIVISREHRFTPPYDIASAAKSSGARVVLLTDRIPPAKTRDVCDLVFVLGRDFNQAKWVFMENLVTAITVSLRGGVPVGKMTYDDVNDTYTIHGAGLDIWGAWDQFHFAHSKLNRDGSITARIDSVECTENWAEAGLMMRDTTAADSAYVTVLITPQNRFRFRYRSEAGKNALEIMRDQDTVSLPHWIKLIREGNTFKAQHSEDGKKWEDLTGGSTRIEIEMDDPVHVGLAVCSFSSLAIAAEAKISRVSFGGDWSPSGKITLSEDIGFEAWGKPGKAEK